MEQLLSHPITESSDQNAVLPLLGQFDNVVEFERNCIERQKNNPVDAIVGDDVSGRILTLITHRVLRLAVGAGQISEAPKTYFMASGAIRDDVGTTERNWGSNMSEHVQGISRHNDLNSVLVITEIVSSGKSVDRLKMAFKSQGIKAGYVSPRIATGNRLHLNQRNPARIGIGVEKHPPEPISRRVREFDGQRVHDLRKFLDEYSLAVYDEIGAGRLRQLSRKLTLGMKKS